MEIYFEELFRYIQCGLLAKIELKAFSDNKISVVNAVNDFSKQKELECRQFNIHFKGLNQLKRIKKTIEDSWIMTCGTGDKGVLFKKNIEVDDYLLNLFNQLIKEIISKDIGYQYIIQSLNIQMLICLLRIIGHSLKGKKKDIYYHKIQAEKALKYLSTHYSKEFFEKDIIRNFNYSHYQQTENIEQRRTEFVNNIKIKKNWDMFMYSSSLCRKLLFEIKFKNNSFVKFS
ncbi:MAG: hypothetical protein ACOC4G_10360, partial [Bacillota bacterium]